tara:strand:- start:102 stop:932 length:831 start_codon:yes stop_codon:yes gene_type:complete
MYLASNKGKKTLKVVVAAHGICGDILKDFKSTKTNVVFYTLYGDQSSSLAFNPLRLCDPIRHNFGTCVDKKEIFRKCMTTPHTSLPISYEATARVPDVMLYFENDYESVKSKFDLTPSKAMRLKLARGMIGVWADIRFDGNLVKLNDILGVRLPDKMMLSGLVKVLEHLPGKIEMHVISCRTCDNTNSSFKAMRQRNHLAMEKDAAEFLGQLVRNLDAANKNKAMSARKTLLAVKKRTNVNKREGTASQKRRANIDYQSLVDSGYLRRSSRLVNGS